MYLIAILLAFVLCMCLLRVSPPLKVKPLSKGQLRCADAMFRKDKRKREMENAQAHTDIDGNTIYYKGMSKWAILKATLRPQMRIRGGYREFMLLRTRLAGLRNKHQWPLFMRYWDFLSYKMTGRPLGLWVTVLVGLVAITSWSLWCENLLLLGANGPLLVAGMAGGLNHPQIATVEHSPPNAELTAAEAINAKEIHFDPTISYAMVATYAGLHSDTIVNGHGAYITSAVDTNLFEFHGSISATKALDANANANQADVTLIAGGVAALGIVSGNWIKIYDNQVLYSATAKKGEWLRVLSTAGDVITCYDKLRYSYTTAQTATVVKINYKYNINVKDLNITGSSGAAGTKSGISTNYLRDSKFENVNLSSFGYCALLITDSQSIQVLNSSFNNNLTAGTGYGIEMGNTAFNISIKGCYFTQCNHGVSHGGDGTIGYPTCTYTYNCNFQSCQSGAFDTHSQCGEEIYVTACSFSQNNTSIQFRGGFGNVGECQIIGDAGYAIYCREYVQNWIINNNLIQNCFSSGMQIDTTGTIRGTISNNSILTTEQYGIYLNRCGNGVIVTGNTIYNCGYRGIVAETTGNVLDISNNILHNNGRLGITGGRYEAMLISTSTGIITGNYIFDTNGTPLQKGIKLEADADYFTISNNEIYITQASSHGIDLTAGSSGHTITGNLFYMTGGRGISINGSSHISITGNNFYDLGWACVRLAGSNNGIVFTGNQSYSSQWLVEVSGSLGNGVISNNQAYSCTGNIYLTATEFTAVNSNELYAGSSGIYEASNTCNSNVYTSNIIHNPTAEGIYVQGDNSIINNNVFDSCTNAIQFVAGADNNRVGHNYFVGNTAMLADAGSGNIYPSFTIPFTRLGGTATDGDEGILVNAADEYAMAGWKNPVHVQQVVKYRISAVAVGAEADKQLADFTSNGGADNEAYNTHTIALASQLTDSGNYAANDIITWTITNAAITALTGGDSVSLKALYRVTDATNEATNCYFRAVEIMYI